ncbi:PaaI family thioesterase [Amycolatopsis minnesotensis]|uniref:Thioesterase domain-containing protein n=1 Tax=Amycolatopsis minnesotensis TaxID=337894 RepID=A0ABP5BBF9_9PSEU
MTTWLTGSPFLADLGVRERDGEIVMAVTEPHTTTGALHGGAIAALAAVSAQAAMRREEPDLEPSTTSLHVAYASAGRGTAFAAPSSTVRRVRELGYYQTDVTDESGRTIAVASSALSAGRRGAAEVPAPPELPGDPAAFTRAVAEVPFLARRGLRVEGTGTGAVEYTMALEERNLDEKGRLHEGALLTLIDLAGSSAPWTGPRPSTGGATISLHAQILGQPPAEAVTARGTVRARDDRVFWCDVDVFTTAGRERCAFGSVAYRFA